MKQQDDYIKVLVNLLRSIHFTDGLTKVSQEFKLNDSSHSGQVFGSTIRLECTDSHSAHIIKENVIDFFKKEVEFSEATKTTDWAIFYEENGKKKAMVY